MTDIEGLVPAPESSRSEYTRLFVIFGILIALIAVPAWLWKRHERNRPTLVEARVVSATTADPRFREGARSVSADDRVRLAVAIRLEYPGKGSRWLAPAEELVIDGTAVDHVNTDSWPEEDRLVRVFWFTLENPLLGGELTAANAAEKLTFRTFFAPELGRGLAADGEPEPHADDGINLGDEIIPVAAGTYRVYARVEIVDRLQSQRPINVATSLGVDALDDPRMARISRRLDPEFGLDPRAGELFRLPGFEVEEAGQLDMRGLAARLVATSSEVFAAVAITGTTAFEDGDVVAVSTFRWPLDRAAKTSHTRLRWGLDIRARDVIRNGTHWIVLVADDGDGVLGPADHVAHVWRRCAALLPLGSALEADPVDLQLYRRPGETP